MYLLLITLNEIYNYKSRMKVNVAITGIDILIKPAIKGTKRSET